MKINVKFKAKVKGEIDPMIMPSDGWVEGWVFQDLDGGIVKTYIHSCPCVWEVDEDTVSQFIGERHNIELYENDIIEYTEGYSYHTGRCNMRDNGGYEPEYINTKRVLKGILYFDNDLLRYMIKPIQNVNYIRTDIGDINIKINKVLGNIFDNTDLLK